MLLQPVKIVIQLTIENSLIALGNDPRIFVFVALVFLFRAPEPFCREAKEFHDVAKEFEHGRGFICVA